MPSARKGIVEDEVCHWILEVHLVDTDLQIGGFFEELLDIGPGPALRG